MIDEIIKKLERLKDVLIKRDTELNNLLKLAIQWNKKEVTGDDFAGYFWHLYEQECRELWNKPKQHHRLRMRIKKEMVEGQ